MPTDNIIPLKPRTSDKLPWRAITITSTGSYFGVIAWRGMPSDPTTAMTLVGYCNSLLEAYDLAHEKAAELGGLQVVDYSSLPPDEPGDAA